LSRLDLVVGPNGAGKSTFVREILARQMPGVHFVNADVIAAERWSEDPANHAYEAAAVAEATRAVLIAGREPFVAETVFSHPSKIALVSEAKAAGYYVAMHVLMVPEELAVARVERRVASGGHDVPEDKIRARYCRLWANVAEAADMVDATTFWDNSNLHGPVLVAELGSGVILGQPRWPAWTPAVFVDRWRR